MTLRLAHCFMLAALAAAAQDKLDILLRGGRVLDGTGAAERRVDIGLLNDRIVFLGDSTGKSATRVIDCSGLIVAPGFIDPHAHVLEDLSDSKRRNNENYLMQGVTTLITGNDGGGPINAGAAMARWKSGGIGVNAAAYVGYGALRREVLGMSAAPASPQQLDQMSKLVESAMRSGALGLSTGLFYAPQSYGRTEEVIELAKVAARFGGIYDSHLRDESSYTVGLRGAVEEAIRIGREAKIAVHIAHIKALGADVWGKSGEIVELINKARAEGIRVTADQYPYTASGTALGAALLPRWAQEGGRTRFLERLGDPEVRTKMIAEMTDNLRRRGGEESLLLLTPHDLAMKGKTLGAAARLHRRTAIDMALDILAKGEVGVASFNMQEEDIERFMKEPWVMTGSDGSAGHPRKYGSFPRKIRRYVFDRKAISLPAAIHQSTSLPAATFGLKDRGELRLNAFADIIVFDPNTISDKATYEQPAMLSQGMRYVLVNGAVAVDQGRYNGALAGRPLPAR